MSAEALTPVKRFVQAIRGLVLGPKAGKRPISQPSIQVSLRAASLPSQAVTLSQLTIKPQETLDLLLNAKEADFPMPWGKFTVFSALGAGGMAKVFLVQGEDGHGYALKVPKSLDQVYFDNFHKESRLSFVSGGSAKIVGVHEIGNVNGVPYIVMDFISGKDLLNLMADSPGHDLPIKDIVNIGLQIAEGLDHLHDLGVIFRDLKLENVLMDEKGNVYLVDLGLAREKELSGTTAGTPEYMSPEQVYGQELDRRADIYALGVVLFTLIHHDFPFSDGNPMRLIARIRTEPPPMDQLPPSVPPALKALIEKMLAKNADNRPQTDAAVMTELRAILAQLP